MCVFINQFFPLLHTICLYMHVSNVDSFMGQHIYDSIATVLATTIVDTHKNRTIHTTTSAYLKQGTCIDVMLDAGAFSGSFLLGGLLVLQKLEHAGWITIEKISGASVGSLFGLLYLSDCLLSHNKLFYETMYQRYSQYGDLESLRSCLDLLLSRLDADFYIKCNGRFFVRFYDGRVQQHVIRSRFHNNQHLCDCVYYSCYIPLLVSRDILAKGFYMDGMCPHVFENESPGVADRANGLADKRKRRVLFFDLHSSYILKMLWVKNETNNHARILEGLVETFQFCMHGSSTLVADIYCARAKYYYNIVFSIRSMIMQFVTSNIHLLHRIVHGRNIHVFGTGTGAGTGAGIGTWSNQFVGYFGDFLRQFIMRILV